MSGDAEEGKGELLCQEMCQSQRCKSILEHKFNRSKHLVLMYHVLLQDGKTLFLTFSLNPKK